MTRKNSLIFVVSLIVGYCLVVAPAYIFDERARDMSFLALPWFALQSFHGWGLYALLFFAGLLLNMTFDVSSFLVGCSIVLPLPLFLLIDLVLYLAHMPDAAGASHNLFPFEIASFAILSVPCLIGAHIGGAIHRHLVDESSRIDNISPLD